MSRIKNNTIDRLVFNLRKPARYVGNELNQKKKKDSFIKIAVCYPDLYEVGMSNNGIRILYDIANSMADVSCERVFAVPDDFEDKIRKMKLPLYTLESYTPLGELDMIGFNVAYELLYTNILQVIDLADIPVFSKDREEGHPVIIAGGEAVSNPLPLSEFIDAFFIGDGEQGIIEIINIIRISKLESLKRRDTIELLSKIEGIYAPYYYAGGKKIRKRAVKAGSLYNPLQPILPNLKITQERFVVEVTRGCKNMCKFCHSGYYELPYRVNKPEIIRDQIIKLTENAYYSDLTLSSLSISDYRHLVKLLNLILPVLIEKGISISLPSLRVDKRTLPIIEQVSDLRKASLTFAVESGCDEIRNIANKKLKTDDILSIAEHVFNKGWNLLKLYFMIGLPGCEEYDEISAIIELLKKIHTSGGKKRNLNVTISPFVPKPHTPFQWEKQMDTGYLLNAIAKIKRGLPRQVSIKAHDVYASLLEGVMSRGDSELSTVIYNSYKEGSRLDSWKEYFKFDIWERNLEKIPGWQKYLTAIDTKRTLPWSFISTGFDALIILQRERKRTAPQETQKPPYEDIDTSAIAESIKYFKRKYDVKKRIRLKLSKTGMAKYISHLDFMAIITRALRMAEMPVSFTQGFNKRERISLGFPLPVGIESICEMCDVDLYDDVDIDAVITNLNSKFPQGISAVKAVYLDAKESVMSITSAALFSVETDDEIFYERMIKNLDLKMGFIKETEKGGRHIGFNDAIIEYNIQKESSSGKGKILIKIRVGDENSMRIDNIALALSETAYDDFFVFRILKLCQYRKGDNGLMEIP